MLETISNALEQDISAYFLHKGEESAWVVPPANEELPLPRNPGEEAFDDRATLVEAQTSAGLVLLADALGAMLSNYLAAPFAHPRAEPANVVGAVVDGSPRRRHVHLEVDSQLIARFVVTIRRKRGDRDLQTLAIDNRHDWFAYAAFDWPDLMATFLARLRVASIEHLDSSISLSSRPSLASLVNMARVTSFSNDFGRRR